MISPRRGVALLGIAAAATVLAGCESTQEKSAALRARAAVALKGQRGLVISQRNASVSVVRTGVVQDENGTAVAVVLRNDAPDAAIDVPIGIDVLDAARRSVYRNNAPGLDPSLISIASIPPHGEATWVNDQVTATGTPRSVTVTVGAARGRATGPLPQIDTGTPRLVNDAISGLEMVGTVTNRSTSDQTRMVMDGVAWNGARLASAGRAVIDRLTTTRPVKYHVLPIGKPGSAPITVSAIPNPTTRGS